MKRTFLIIALASLSLGMYAQSGTVAAGGDGSSSSGSVAFSVGQPFSQVGQVNEGVQQPYTVTVIVGVKELELDEMVSMKVYPNPATDFLKIQSDESRNYSFQLLSMDGKLLEQNQFNKTVEVGMANYPSGVYFIHVFQGNSATTFKIVKK